MPRRDAFTRQQSIASVPGCTNMSYEAYRVAHVNIWSRYSNNARALRNDETFLCSGVKN